MVAAARSCSFGSKRAVRPRACVVVGDVGADCDLLFGAASSRRVREGGCVIVVLGGPAREVAVPRDAAGDARVGDLLQHGGDATSVGGTFDYDALEFRQAAFGGFVGLLGSA